MGHGLTYDRSEAEAVIQAATGIDRRTVMVVLDLHDEYMIAVGLMRPAEPHDFQFYDPTTFVGNQRVDDTTIVAGDAERLLGIRREVAQQVLDGEYEYLQSLGLVRDLDV